MSMSVHVMGFRPPDEKWKAMKQAYDACKLAKVSPPKEVSEFFDWETPDPAGVQVSIKLATQEWHDPVAAASGFEIDIRKLPKDVTIIRFYNSF